MVSRSIWADGKFGRFRRVVEQANERGRDRVAEEVNDEDVDGEGRRADGRMRDVGEYGVRRTGVKEQTELGEEEQNPDDAG